MKVQGQSPALIKNTTGGQVLCSFPKNLLWGLLSVQNGDAVETLYMKVGCKPGEKVSVTDHEYEIGPRGSVDLDLIDPTGDVLIISTSANGVSTKWHAEAA